MTTPVWKLLPLQEDQSIQVVWREWPDGRQESCLVTATEYLKWLDAGNTPLLAEGNAPIGADTPLPAETPDAG
jgi:hypothetical protein